MNRSNRPHARRIRTAVLALLVALAVSRGASAGYREAPPKGVVLAGTSWALDPHRSDDPRLAVKAARDDLEAQRRKAQAERRRSGRRTGPGDGGLPGGEFPGGGRGGRGGYDTGRGDPGALPDEYRDPDEAEQRAGPDPRDGGPPGIAQLEELARNPQRLAMSGARGTLRIEADGASVECEAGNDTTLQDRIGYGTRRCGWDGRAWVVETRHDDGSRRIDRYEPSADGRTLAWSTSLDMKRLPRVIVTRTYAAVR